MCHRVAKLGQAGRLLEAARYAIEACRSQMEVCDVWPAMRQHLKEQVLRYLQAVVAELAGHIPDSDSPYAELCWEPDCDDGERCWKFLPSTITAAVKLYEVCGGLSIDGWLKVADTWQAHWSLVRAGSLPTSGPSAGGQPNGRPRVKGSPERRMRVWWPPNWQSFWTRTRFRPRAPTKAAMKTGRPVTSGMTKTPPVSRTGYAPQQNHRQQPRRRSQRELFSRSCRHWERHRASRARR